MFLNNYNDSEQKPYSDSAGKIADKIEADPRVLREGNAAIFDAIDPDKTPKIKPKF